MNAGTTTTNEQNETMEIETEAIETTNDVIAEGPSVTRVELEHRGWEVHGDEAEEPFQSYTTGWDPVLARYVERAGG